MTEVSFAVDEVDKQIQGIDPEPFEPVINMKESWEGALKKLLRTFKKSLQ